MKKRILSILLAVCMVAAMVPAMPTTASAADTCTCPAKCTDSYKDPDCPVCSSGGTCESRRNRRIYDDSTGITTQFHLQAALDWKDAAHYLYYFPLDADITVSSNITVPENADFVLDLNGHTLSGNHVWAIFKVYGKLTIKTERIQITVVLPLHHEFLPQHPDIFCNIALDHFITDYAATRVLQQERF